MKVRKHFFLREHCVFCGAMEWTKLQRLYSDRGQAVPQVDERSCVERDDHFNANELRPEPKRREYACEDFTTISEAVKKLQEVAPAEDVYVEDFACGLTIKTSLDVYGWEYVINTNTNQVLEQRYTAFDRPEWLLKLSEKSIG